MAQKKFYQSLYLQVIVGILIGALLGHFYPEAGAAMKPLGDGFIKLIKMMIAPIIFCTVVTGIAGMEKMREVGRTGGLALIYFEVVTTFALIIGLVVVNVLRPGVGMNVDPSTLDTHAIAEYAKPGGMPGAVDFLLAIIPTTFVGAFSGGDVLQTLLLAILFGFALHAVGGRENIVYQFVDRTSQVLFRIVGLVMKVALLGAFGAMAFTVGKYGAASLLSLAKLMGCFYLTCVLFILGVLGAIARFHGFSVVRFVRYIKEELFIVFGTS